MFWSNLLWLGVGNVFKITLQSIMAWVGHNCMITLNIKLQVEVLFYLGWTLDILSNGSWGNALLRNSPYRITITCCVIYVHHN